MVILLRSAIVLLGLLATAAADLIVDGRAWVVSTVESGPRGEWVLYPAGSRRTPATRRWLTRRLLVEFTPGQPGPSLTRIPGFSQLKTLGRYRMVTVTGNASTALDAARRRAEQQSR